MTTVGLFLSLLACTGGANPETLVDELRILALVFEPPEAPPGSPVQVVAHLADPKEKGAELAAWTCVGFGGTCLESDASRAEVAEGSPPALTLSAPAEAAAFFEEEEEVPVSVWAWACETGQCQDLDDSLEDAEFLSNPIETLEDRPIEGISLARRTFWVSLRDAAAQRQNPEVSLVSELPSTVAPSSEMTLAFAVNGPAESGFGYATAGGFSETESEVDEGELELTWVAPEEGGVVTLWVVVQSEDQGTAVWSESVQVN
jgi:hypothetical protein